jgi:hypothetical protein
LPSFCGWFESKIFAVFRHIPVTTAAGLKFDCHTTLKNIGWQRFSGLSREKLPGAKLTAVGRLVEVVMEEVRLVSLPMNLKKSCFGWAAGIASVLVLAENAGAQFTYNSGDVLVCFRSTGSPTYDLIVDAGSISTFTNLPTGNNITISYAPSQLAKVGTNNVAWSVCASFYNYPVSDDTWLTRPRASLNSPTSPLKTGSPSFMSPIAQDIDGSPGLGNDAAFINDTVINTTTVIAETESGHSPNVNQGSCYAWFIEYPDAQAPFTPVTASGNFRSDVPNGVGVEQIAPANFTTSGQPSRADFYQLLSRAGTVNQTSGTYLGYFEFSTNGIMTYTAGPSPTVVTAPTITSFVRMGTTNIVTFTTVNGGTYNLTGTNDVTVSKASWPVIGSSVAGTGSLMSITNMATNSLNYYRISAH